MTPRGRKFDSQRPRTDSDLFFFSALENTSIMGEIWPKISRITLPGGLPNNLLCSIPSSNHVNSLYERLVRIVFFSTFRIIHLFRLFELSTSWWEVKMIDFTEYIRFFRLFSFRPLGGRSNDQFHWICWIFSTFFDLLLGGQTDRFYWICWIVRLFNLLLGGLIDWVYLIYWNFSTFRLFELLVKWWEVKMINFTTDYIGFLRLSTSCCGVKIIDFTAYIGFFRLFDFSTRCGW